tara:strand:- start:1431 stop:3101 length:1671 start_codon:yes stop_codon:yes gene_type:complete
MRVLVYTLALVLTVQPLATVAQSLASGKNDEGKRTRSGLEVFSAQGRQGQRTLTEALAVDMTTISKDAYDAVILTGDYVLGTGDTFSILVDTDDGVVVESVPVGADGGLIVPFVGVVPVAGKRLAVAKADIDAAIESRFQHLDISVNLFRLRSFPINVIGEVQFPGAYNVRGVEHVSELILRAGGLLDESRGRASVRNIKILRRTAEGEVSGPARRADLLLWNLTGDPRYNPYVLDGDQIFVPVKGDSISIAGGVHLPGNYEYALGDRLSDLIQLGRGLIGDPESATAQLLRLGPDGTTTQAVDLQGALAGDPALDILLTPGDKIFVTGDRPRVTVQGEVRFPGAYPIEGGLRLRELINRAGGFTEFASRSQSVVIRRVEYGVRADEDVKLERLLSLPRNQLSDGDLAYITMNTQQAPGRIPVDFVALFERGDDRHNVELQGDDVIRVPRLRPTVLVNGSVAAPAAIPYDPNYSLSDYIRDAGGFTSAARRGDVYIIQGSSGHSVEASKVETVSPGDAIFVPSKTQGQGWRTFRETLTIAAQIASLALIIDAITRK